MMPAPLPEDPIYFFSFSSILFTWSSPNRKSDPFPVPQTCQAHFHSLGFACYGPGLLASLINRNWLEGMTRNSGKALLGPCFSRWEWEQTADGLVCMLSFKEGTSLFFIWGGQIVSRDWAGGWLGYFAHPLGTVVFRGHAQYPAFSSISFFFFLLQTLQKWQLGFFGPFVSFGFRICHNC